MTTGAVNSEQYNISDARTGSIRVSRLTLTGWGAAPTSSAGLFTWSDQGRMWARFIESTGVLTLYRRSTMAAGDAVCNGTVTAGMVTLAAANDSGISGSADVDDGTPSTNPSVDADLDVVVSYADEVDLLKILARATGLLEGTPPTYMGLGGTRFEALLVDARQTLDRWLIEKLGTKLRHDAWGRPLLAHIVRQRDLSRVQALIAANMAATARGAGVNVDQLQQAEYLIAEARREFKMLRVDLDYERDLSPDAGVTTRMRLYRA